MPPPALLTGAARAGSRASVNLECIVVGSVAYLWTSLRLLLAASWVLRRLLRSVSPLGRTLTGSFSVTFILADLFPAVAALVATAWCVVRTVLHPPCQCWHVGGASPMARAAAHPVDLGHRALDQRAGPPTTASMFFFEGSVAIAGLAPPSSVGGRR